MKKKNFFVESYAPRWLSTISYPMRAHGIIVKYMSQTQEVYCSSEISHKARKRKTKFSLSLPTELFHCCYYPEHEAFRCQVASIVNRFRSDGFNVIMDSMVSYQISSQGPMRWAETQIRMAKKVLVFLSPGLLRIASGNISDVQSQDVQVRHMEIMEKCLQFLDSLSQNRIKS